VQPEGKRGTKPSSKRATVKKAAKRKR